MADRDSTKSPAFQFYPKDYLSDAKTRVMTFKQRGMYWDLVSHCWLEKGLPADPKEIARILGITSVARFVKDDWPIIARCFRQTESGDHQHPRLEVERRKQDDFRESARSAGKASGNARRLNDRSFSVQRNTNGKATEDERKGNGTPNGRATEGQRKPNSPISYLLSPSVDQDQERERDTHAERAGNFIEAYRELHQRYRGVAYLGNPVQDYQQAQYLVAAFDDAMLEKLAVYWLNDTDDFASQGTRSLAKLRSRASKYAEELKAKRLA
jgi:uncharacterized protein YdaU (DUF1376 family)